MSDHPTRAGRPDRPLWGPVRRPGEVTPSPGPLDAPRPDADPTAVAAPPWNDPVGQATAPPHGPAVPAVPPVAHPVTPAGPPWSGPPTAAAPAWSAPAESPWSGPVVGTGPAVDVAVPGDQHAGGPAPTGPRYLAPDPEGIAAGATAPSTPAGVPSPAAFPTGAPPTALPPRDGVAGPAWGPDPGAPAAFGGPATGNPYAGTLGGDLYGAPSRPASSPLTETRQRITVPPQWTGPEAAPNPPPGIPPAPPAAGGWSRTRLVAVGLTCAVALLIAGSGVVWAMSRVPDRGTDAASVSPASVAPAPASTTVAPDPTVRSSSGLVQIDAAAASSPLAQPVAELLDRHFTSINTLDYPTWTSTVSSRRAADQTADRWRSDYRSTRDGDIHVTSITDDGSGGATVGLRFTSQQDVADAPSDLPVGRICWSSRWPVTGLPSAGTIGTAPKGTTSKQAC